jgi:hypothetical protein
MSSMTGYDIDSVLSIAPEFKCESPETLNDFIGLARLRVDPSIWGLFYGAGVCYLAAHLLALSKRRGSSGAVTSARVGDLQVSYAAVNTSSSRDMSYMQTSYGMEFLSLRGMVIIPCMAV